VKYYNLFISHLTILQTTDIKVGRWKVCMCENKVGLHFKIAACNATSFDFSQSTKWHRAYVCI